MKAWVKGAVVGAAIFGGFFLFWIGVIARIFPEGPSFDLVGFFLYYPIDRIFLRISHFFNKPFWPNFLISGFIFWLIVGASLGGLIGIISNKTRSGKRKT